MVPPWGWVLALSDVYPLCHGQALGQPVVPAQRLEFPPQLWSGGPAPGALSGLGQGPHPWPV